MCIRSEKVEILSTIKPEPLTKLFFFVFLCLISLLLFPCATVMENTRAWVSHFLEPYWIVLYFVVKRDGRNSGRVACQKLTIRIIILNARCMCLIYGLSGDECLIDCACVSWLAMSTSPWWRESVEVYYYCYIFMRGMWFMKANFFYIHPTFCHYSNSVQEFTVVMSFAH